MRVLAATAGACGRELRHVRLVVGGRIGVRRLTAALQEGDAAQAGIAIAALVTTAALLTTATLFAATALFATATLFATTTLLAATTFLAATALVTAATLFATALTIVLLAVLLLLLGHVAAAVAIGLWPVGLALLLRIARLLAFLAALAPTLVVAMGEAAHGLDDAVVVVGVLPVGLGHDAIARRRRLASQRLVFVEYLMGVAAHADIRSAAIENLVPIGRTVGVVGVVLLVMLVTAATAAIAAATRPLPIVWSH